MLDGYLGPVLGSRGRVTPPELRELLASLARDKQHVALSLRSWIVVAVLLVVCELGWDYILLLVIPAVARR